VTRVVRLITWYAPFQDETRFVALFAGTVGRSLAPTWFYVACIVETHLGISTQSNPPLSFIVVWNAFRTEALPPIYEPKSAGS
jgi:hypothetical protein